LQKQVEFLFDGIKDFLAYSVFAKIELDTCHAVTWCSSLNRTVIVVTQTLT